MSNNLKIIILARYHIDMGKPSVQEKMLHCKSLECWKILILFCVLYFVFALKWSTMQSKPNEIRYVAVNKTEANVNISFHEHEYNERNKDITENGYFRRKTTMSSKWDRDSCSNLPAVSPDIPLSEQWMPVILPSNDSLDYVFAAYLYTKDGRRQVVVTAMTSNNTQAFVCQIWHTGKGKGQEGKVYHQITPCWYRMVSRTDLYQATLLYCPIKAGEEPFAVSIVQAKDPCSAPHNVLRIRDASFPDDKNDTVAVCVKPFYGSYGGFNRTARLVEFIEVYKMLGASYFTLYAFDLNCNITCPILKYYEQEKRLSVIPWQAPPNLRTKLKQFVDSTKRWVRDAGQALAQTDCLYRSMGKYTHIAMVDIDEFLIPRSNMTFQKLFSVLPKHQGAYTFRNRFFHIDSDTWLSNLTSFGLRIRKYRPRTIMATRGESALVNRPKYVALSEGTWSAVTHHARLIEGYNDYVVPVELGAMHHYRDNTRIREHQYDPYMLSYKEEILHGMEYVFNKTKAQVVD